MANVVTLSLSDEAYEVWQRFPKGTRSSSIAAMLIDAEELRIRGLLIENLRQQIRKHKELIHSMDLRILNQTTMNESHPSDAELAKMRNAL